MSVPATLALIRRGGCDSLVSQAHVTRQSAQRRIKATSLRMHRTPWGLERLTTRCLTTHWLIGGSRTRGEDKGCLRSDWRWHVKLALEPPARPGRCGEPCGSLCGVPPWPGEQCPQHRRPLTCPYPFLSLQQWVAHTTTAHRNRQCPCCPSVEWRASGPWCAPMTATPKTRCMGTRRSMGCVSSILYRRQQQQKHSRQN